MSASVRPGGHPGRRILALLPFPPRRDGTHGGSRVTSQLLAVLAERHQVAALYLRGPDEPPMDDALRARCALVEEIARPPAGAPSPVQHAQVIAKLLLGKPLWAIDWYVGDFAERVRALAQEWQPDIVQIDFHIMAQYLPALQACPAPRVLVEHEPGAASALDRWQGQRAARIMPHLDARAWQHFERAVIGQVQAVVVFTERDRQAVAQLTRRAPQTQIVCIPLGTPLPAQALNPRGEEPPGVLFIGNFAHPPNVDAATRLVRDIMPRVRERYPRATLHLVGDGPPPEVQKLASPHVAVTGRVPDVTPYLDRAAVVAAPLRLGGGMRVKVLEALAAGKAVVASPLAVEGLDLTGGEQFLLAESDDQFAAAITQLLADPAARAILAQCARAWACAHLGWDRAAMAYESLYDLILGQQETLA